MPYFQREILPRNTATNKQRVRPRAIRILHRRLIKDICRIERAGGPSNITKVDVVIFIQECNLLAQILDAGRDIAAPGLGEDGNAVVLAERCGERSKGTVDVVCDAFGVGAACNICQL